MSTQSTYLDLADGNKGGGHQINLWWSDAQPDRIHLVITDPRLVDSKGEKPGLRLVLSSNPKSADYSPANFNRSARLLRSLGMPAPAQDVAEHPRHLRYRDSVIDSVFAGSNDAAKGSSENAVAAVSVEAVLCQDCWCYVSDLSKHDEAAHA